MRDEYRTCLGETPPKDGGAVADAGKVRTTVRLNLRSGAPSRRAPVHQTVPAGTELEYAKVVEDGEAVNGNMLWLGTAKDQFFWSGGVQWG